MIDPPNSTDISLTRPSRKEQSKRDHKSKKRRRHRSSSSSSSTSTSRSDSLSSSRRQKNSNRSKHSHKKRRRRSMTPSSSSNTSQSQLDISRYTRAHKSPQVVQTPTPIQSEETGFIPINNQPINFDQFQPNKESDSETESEVCSLDRAINEVFRLLPPELCPKTLQDQAPLKPLSGIEQLMETRSTPLLVLPQSKLVGNTTKYIQNRLDSDKCSRDWICPQSLVSALAPTKFYKS